MMQARFHGAAYDGYTFTVPDSPYRGLDVAYADKVLRYGFDRVEEGVAVYVFARELDKPLNPYHQIDIHADMRAVPLRFYPPKRP